MSHAARHPLPLLALMLALPCLSGCGMFGSWFVHGLFGDQNPAVYKPPDRPTVVLVEQADGPNGPTLGNARLSETIATSIAFHLDKEGVLSKSNIVDQKRVIELQQRLGASFAHTSDRDIARQLGAEQSLRVVVHDAEVDGVGPGMYQPKARVYVWLYDAKEQQFLFPKPGAGRDDLTPDIPSGPYVVEPSLHHKAGDLNDPTLVPLLRTKLAERIGRDVVRLFHSYDKDKPGEDFAD